MPMLALDQLQPGFRTEDTVAYLLLLMFMKVMILGGLCVTMAVFIVRQNRSTAKKSKRSKPAARPSERVLFEPPSRWLALKSDDGELISQALGLKNPTPCDWDDGINTSREDQLFLAPPVDGWTLVFGPGLRRYSDDPGTCFHMMRRLSKHVGTAQFFTSNRVFDHHGWVLACDGQILRGYSWAGETLWDQGNQTSAERDLGMICFAYGEACPEEDTASKDPSSRNSERVHLLAGKWSIDPVKIDSGSWSHQSGFVGDL